MEKEKHEQAKQVITQVRGEMHKELEAKNSIIADLEARIESMCLALRLNSLEKVLTQR